jgi:hypothetical protein
LRIPNGSRVFRGGNYFFKHPVEKPVVARYEMILYFAQHTDETI